MFVIETRLLPETYWRVTEFFSLCRLNLSPVFNVSAPETVTQAEALCPKLIQSPFVVYQLRNFPLSTSFRSV